MEQGYFITGTDTHVGKTWATVALMRYFKAKGKSVIGLKPVASGCFFKGKKLVNEDALLLQENASVTLDYDLINPYAYELPVSPHIAGNGNPADLQAITGSFTQLKGMAQVLIVEGAGGWYSPLNDKQGNNDLANALGLPVILVVAIRLGCINHAKLTFEAIKGSSVGCAGWIAVHSDSAQLSPGLMVSSISDRLDAPLLGELPYIKTPDFDNLAEGFLELWRV